MRSLLRCRATVGLLVMAVAFVGVCAAGQTTTYAPYVVVDPQAVQRNTVFNYIADALAYLNDLPVPEADGATVMIYPGEYTITATLNVSIPRLRIVALGGADRTKITDDGVFVGPMMNVTAPGVQIEGLQIAGSGKTKQSPKFVGISITQAGCVVSKVLVQGNTGDGIEVLLGGNRTSIGDSTCTGNGGHGISVAAGVDDARIDTTACSSNTGSGVSLATTRKALVESCTLVGNGADGLTVVGGDGASILSCTFSSNTGAGCSATDAARLSIRGCSISGNTGGGVSLTGMMESSVADSQFDQNTGPGITVTGSSTLCAVTANTVSLEAWAGLTASPGILVTGKATACTVSYNRINGYTWGMRLGAPAAPPATPRGNRFEQNTIESPLSAGVQVTASGGGNTFALNSVLNSAGDGFFVSAAASDSYDGNSVTGATLAGMSFNAGSAGSLTSVMVQNCTLAKNGRNGIEVLSTVAGGVSGFAIANCVVEQNVQDGVVVKNNPIVLGAYRGVLIERNTIRGNQRDGIVVAGAPGCVIGHNAIEGNLAFGLNVINDAGSGENLRITRNRVAWNAGGGLLLNMTPAPSAIVPAIVDENEFVSNQGFGLSVLNWPAGAPFPPPFKLGMDIGRNWWGSPDGPSGVYGGTGNAVLGLGDNAAIAPVLAAPMYAGPSPTSMQVLEQPQAAILTSFASGRVDVNRLDTAGLRLTFSNVQARTPGWVCTAAYTEQATAKFFTLNGGRTLRAAAVLVSGLTMGDVEVAVKYDASELAGADPARLWLYAYRGGVWQVDSGTGDWYLSGGQLLPLRSCAAAGSEVVIGEFKVTELLRDVAAILLVLKD